jgi:hypothetical protein
MTNVYAHNSNINYFNNANEKEFKIPNYEDVD